MFLFWWREGETCKRMYKCKSMSVWTENRYPDVNRLQNDCLHNKNRLETRKLPYQAVPRHACKCARHVDILHIIAYKRDSGVTNTIKNVQARNKCRKNGSNQIDWCALCSLGGRFYALLVSLSDTRTAYSKYSFLLCSAESNAFRNEEKAQKTWVYCWQCTMHRVLRMCARDQTLTLANINCWTSL